MPESTLTGSVQSYDAILQRNVLVPMRDGTRMGTNIYFPARNGKVSPGRFPVIVERTPYNKNRLSLHLSGLFFARFGYVCAIQDSRGRGDSEGEFAMLFNVKHEGDDGYDTIEWLAAQPWSDGKVGTIGLSFTGMNQQAVAVCKPPSLASQFILDCGINYWSRPLRQNGAFGQGIMYPYVFRMARDGKEAQANPEVARLLDQDYRNLIKYLDRLPLKPGTTSLAHAPSYEAWYLGMATHSDYDEFWHRLTANQEEHIEHWKDVPICFVTGWYGHHVNSNFFKYHKLKALHKSPPKLIIGHWAHNYEIMETTWAGGVDFGIDASMGALNTHRLRWFDQTLKGLDTGVYDTPGIQYFVMGGGSGRMTGDWRMDHGGRWAATEAWPPPGSTSTRYYFHGDGSLRPEPQSEANASITYTFNPKDPVPTVGGMYQTPGVPGLIEGGAFDQRGNPKLFAACKDTLPLSTRQDVLVFQTPPLAEDVELTGDIKARLWVSSSAVDTDFTVKLVDVYPPNPDYPEGFAMNIQDTIVRMRYRNGRTTGELIKPGEIYELDLSVYNTSNVFSKGHRIRVDISSSNFPLWDVNPNTGGPLGVQGPVIVAQNTLHHDREHPSQIELPVMQR